MSETQNEPTVSGSDLQKSIESLMALLDAEAPNADTAEQEMEKSMVATEGGLADQAGAPSLNPELAIGGAEAGELGADEEDEDLDRGARQVFAGSVKKSATRSEDMNKSEAAEQEMGEVDEVLDEEFAKSLAAAFAEQEMIVESAASNEFAKSLVLSTIEGLSIAHEEFEKSLAGLEARNDAKIAALAKGLVAIAHAVDEIRAEVVKVSNAPVRPMAKSVQPGVQALEKSFGGNGGPVDPALVKSKVMGALEQRVQKGTLDAFQLVRYESAGVMDPALAKEIQSELGL